MRLFAFLVCVITVTCVLAGSPLVQVNIGADTIANAICDDGTNTCKNQQGNSNNGNNGQNGKGGNPGNGGNRRNTNGGNTGALSNGNGSNNNNGKTGNNNNNNNNSTPPPTTTTTPVPTTTSASTSPPTPTPTPTVIPPNATSPSGAFSGNASDYCFAEVEGTCSAQQNNIFCKSSYGDFDPMAAQFSQMVRNIMRHSYEYLALYIQHTNYLVNRKGFGRTFLALSNKNWDLAKYTISYITERGGVMDFGVPKPPPCSCECPEDCGHNQDSSLHSMFADLIDGPVDNGNNGGVPNTNTTGTAGGTGNGPSDPGEYAGNPDGYQLGEIESLAFSADIEKQIAVAADGLHLIAVGANGHDVQSCLYLQDSYIRPQRKIIGNLVRYVNTLSQMLTSIDQMEAYYHFDDLLWSYSVFD